MSADTLTASPDLRHITSFVADQTVASLFPAANSPVARYLEAVSSGNIAIVTAAGTSRTLPFYAGQFRVIQYTAILSAGTTVTGAIVGL